MWLFDRLIDRIAAMGAPTVLRVRIPRGYEPVSRRVDPHQWETVWLRLPPRPIRCSPQYWLVTVIAALHLIYKAVTK